jgi:hypothetical protein
MEHHYIFFFLPSLEVVKTKKKMMCSKITSAIIIMMMMMATLSDANSIISMISIPSEYDARALRPKCAVWNTIMNQGGIASCCSFAMATALSARDCMRDGRNRLYSPQQIWDCSGPSISDTQNGTLLQHLITGMGDTTNIYSAQFLVPYACAPTPIQSEPSLMRCSQTFAACHPGFVLPPIKASVIFRLSTYSGPLDYGVILAARYMMFEIMQNGPVIGVLATHSVADRMRFEALPPDTIFIPIQLEPLTDEGYHCIVVYGWGVESGIHFWRVQNSYGAGWSDKGVGRIIRGTLERNWRSVSTPSRPCLNNIISGDDAYNKTNITTTHTTNNSECIYPPLFDQKNASDEEGGGGASRPLNTSSSPFYHYYPFFRTSADKPKTGLVAISNEIIISITVVTALIVGILLYNLMRTTPRRRPVRRPYEIYYFDQCERS